LQQTVYSC
jgi:hypothetical protein